MEVDHLSLAGVAIVFILLTCAGIEFHKTTSIMSQNAHNLGLFFILKTNRLT